MRVLKNQGHHTKAIKRRYDLRLIHANRVLNGRRKIANLSVGSKFTSFPRQAYQPLEQWLGRTAPQLNPTMKKHPPWLLRDTTAVQDPL